MCIMKGIGGGFYPYLSGEAVRSHKMLVEDRLGRRTPEGEVSCMQKICMPNRFDGCADEVNLVAVNAWLGLLKGVPD